MMQPRKQPAPTPKARETRNRRSMQAPAILGEPEPSYADEIVEAALAWIDRARRRVNAWCAAHPDELDRAAEAIAGVAIIGAVVYGIVAWWTL